jgi:hypothetical protein
MTHLANTLRRCQRRQVLPAKKRELSIASQYQKELKDRSDGKDTITLQDYLCRHWRKDDRNR